MQENRVNITDVIDKPAERRLLQEYLRKLSTAGIRVEYTISVLMAENTNSAAVTAYGTTHASLNIICATHASCPACRASIFGILAIHSDSDCDRDTQEKHEERTLVTASNCHSVL